MSFDTKTILSAVKEAKQNSKKRNFTQSIELMINLRDIDMKKPESKIQEFVELPHISEKKARVCVIAGGDLAVRAKQAGADLVIDRTELEALAGDKKKMRELANNYDFFIAEAPLMPLVGKILGPLLGPRAKMPTPIAPMADIGEQIEKRRKMVLIRTRGQPVIQCRVGSENMPDEEIAENILAVLRVVEGKLKRGIKNISQIKIKTAMGSPVKVKTQ
jgi:large subunit ribosomal protein L1